ncbi:hypothetical protein [Neorickettsia sennetsu]|nr:hypothetical protein [Neorickettsia sennetsu]
MISSYLFYGLGPEDKWRKVLRVVLLVVAILLFAILVASLILLCRCCRGEKSFSPESAVQQLPQTVPSTNVLTSEAIVVSGVRKGILDQMKGYTFIDPVGRVTTSVARLTGGSVSVLTNPAIPVDVLPSTVEGLLGKNCINPWGPLSPQSSDIASHLSYAVHQALMHVTEPNQGEILLSASDGRLCLVCDPRFFTSGVTRFGYTEHTPVRPAVYVAANAWARAIFDWLAPLRQPGCILEGTTLMVLLPGPEFECHFINVWRSLTVFAGPEMEGALRVRCMPELFAASEPSYDAQGPLRN